MNILKSIENEVRTKFSSEPAHDFNHIKRVYNNAKILASKEKANTKLVLAAALLHDIVSFPKSDPRLPETEKTLAIPMAPNASSLSAS